MAKMEEQLYQEQMEKGVAEVLAYVDRDKERMNQMMQPQLVECNVKEQTVTIEYPIQDWQLNQSNNMHGGIIATAFDETCGIFAYYLNSGKPLVTANMSLTYLKPVPIGDSILITAKVSSHGKRLIVMSAECRLKSSGLLTNTAIITFTVL